MRLAQFIAVPWLGLMCALGVTLPVRPEEMTNPPRPPAVAGERALPVELSARDQDRIGHFDENRAAAIAQATKNPASRSDLDDLKAVLSGSELPMAQNDIIGEWRCRTLKLGGGISALTIYSFFKCRIFTQSGSLIFQKTSGSQRTRGNLQRLSETKYFYWGASTVNDDPPIPYGAKASEDEVAFLFRVGANRLRLEFPKPYYESDFDIMELRK